MELRKKLESKKKELEGRLKVQTLKEVFKDLKKNVLSTSQPLKTGIKSFDEDLEGKLRGKVGAYIGYGGTKKSLLALNGANVSAMCYKSNCLYSTMEMPATQLLERIFDLSEFISNSNFRTSKEVEAIIKQNNQKMIEEIEEFLDQIYGDSFKISQVSRMTTEEYRKIIQNYNETHETPLDILVVDGLSMMGGDGTETEVYSHNSGELKDLAKEFNIYIALICHVSKGAQKHTREIQRFIRGSEKILDNVDFIIQHSLVAYSYEGDEIDYINNKGWLRMYNKRGSGKTIDVIYDFDEKTLKMEESLEPKENYVYKKSDKNHFLIC